MLQMPDDIVRCWVPGPMESPAGHPRGLVPFITLMGSVHVARMPCLAQKGLGLCMMLECHCYARPCRRDAGARKAPKCPPSFLGHPHSQSGCSILGAFGQAGGLWNMGGSNPKREKRHQKTTTRGCNNWLGGNNCGYNRAYNHAWL